MELNVLQTLLTADDRDLRRKLLAADRAGESTARSLQSRFNNLRLNPKVNTSGLNVDAGGRMSQERGRFVGGGGGGGEGAGDLMGSIKGVAGGNLLSGAIMGGVTALGGAMKEGWKMGIQYNSMLENANVRLKRFFETGKQTSDFVASVEKFAADSPVFQLDEAIMGAQRLLDMKFSAQEVIPALAAIGDAVGGIGGNLETIDRVTLSLQQMAGKGQVYAEEMQQLVEAGLPAWELLAKAIGKTEKETRKLVEQGRVKGGAVKGIIAMAGEKFAGQSEAAGKTFSGLQSQLESAAQQAAGKSVKGNFDQYKQAMQAGLQGLGTDAASQAAAELDRLLTDIGKKFDPALKEFAQGRYFEAMRDSINNGRQAAYQAEQGNIGAAANATGRAVGYAAGMKTGAAGEEQTAAGIVGKMDDLDKRIAAPVVKAVTATIESRVAQTTLDLFSSAMSAIGIDTGRKAQELGTQAGNSLGAGLDASKAAVQASGAAVGKAAEDGVRNSLDQHSPSQVMLSLGHDAAMSFADGFEQGKKKIQPIKPEDLYRQQYQRAQKQGYDEEFDKASQRTGIRKEVLMGVGSRETNMRNIIGDGGRGAGLMQVDIGTDAAFKASGAWKDAGASIQRGADILKEKFDWLIKMSGKDVSFKDKQGTQRKFTVPKLEGEDLEQTALAMYNSGIWGAYHRAQGRSPDRGTTGGDYSQDVLARSEYFKQFAESAQQSVVTVASLGGALDVAKQKIVSFTDSLPTFGQAVDKLKQAVSQPGQATRGAAAAVAKTVEPVNQKVAQRINQSADAVATSLDNAAKRVNQAATGGVTVRAGVDPISVSNSSVVGNAPLPTSLPTFAEANARAAQLAKDSLNNLTTSVKAIPAPVNQASFAMHLNGTQAGMWADQIEAATGKFGTAEERLSGFKDRLGQGFDDAIAALATGGARWQDIAKQIGVDFFNTLAQEMMLKATGGKHGSLGGLLGGLVGGLFGGLFGGGGVAGGKAEGGPVKSGKTYLVGEKGPELFTPDRSGYIVPNNQLSKGQVNGFSASPAYAGAPGVGMAGYSPINNLGGTVSSFSVRPTGSAASGGKGSGLAGYQALGGDRQAVATYNAFGVSGVKPGRAADGAMVRGEGSSRSDDIPMWLSDGEYVSDARTVDSLGSGFFRALPEMARTGAIQELMAERRRSGQGYGGRRSMQKFRRAGFMADGGFVAGSGSVPGSGSGSMSPHMPPPLPTQKAQGQAEGDGGKTVVNNITINVPITASNGNVPRQTQQQIATQTGQAVQMAVARNS